MRIGIDARFFGPKDKGFGRYTENLVKEMEKIYPLIGGDEFFIFLRKDSFDEYNPQNKKFQKVLADYKWYGLKEQILFPLRLKKYRLDLMHFTHFNVPILYRKRFIVTIHDLTLRYFPTRKGIKFWAYKIVFKYAIKNSEKIIAISNYTKNDILKHYNVSSDKIQVIYEGVTGEAGSLPQNPNPYVLYVGNDYPHKNLERLKLACEKIRQDGLEHSLILITGFVGEQELDNLYKNASLFVFPSLYEGFGLPPLEAMKRGIPVASSNATCLPEILGDAAIYFNPSNVDDMVEKIKRALVDRELRERLIKKGFEQIQKYSWQKMARETLEIYKKST
jgi:glycosyltransferase involved in cell wall biosynthesis